MWFKIPLRFNAAMCNCIYSFIFILFLNIQLLFLFIYLFIYLFCIHLVKVCIFCVCVPGRINQYVYLDVRLRVDVQIVGELLVKQDEPSVIAPVQTLITLPSAPPSGPTCYRTALTPRQSVV